MNVTHPQEVSDLQEQLRDVMFYLEAQQKLSNVASEGANGVGGACGVAGVSQAEIQDGQVIVGASPSPQGREKKARKKRWTSDLWPVIFFKGYF